MLQSLADPSFTLLSVARNDDSDSNLGIKAYTALPWSQQSPEMSENRMNKKIQEWDLWSTTVRLSLKGNWNQVQIE